MVDITNKEIYELLQTVIKKSDNIENQIQENKTELKQEIRTNTAEIRNELNELKQKNKELNEENKNLKERLLVIERKIKKYNLIIYGVEEEENKIEEISSLLNLITEKLNIDCQFTDIRDYYRIGQKTQQGRNRPVSIEFINYQLKQEILINAKKLQGTGVFITSDYIPEDYEERKVLHENLKIARENNLTAYIKHKVLFINDEKYTYEELKNQPIVILTEEEVEEEKNSEKNSNNQPLHKSTTKTPVPPHQPTNSREEKRKSFTFIANSGLKNRKRKEQPTYPENPLKRASRLKK